ncbi:ATP-dependent DNA helicase UvrD2 [soil metagenome]
MDPQSLLTSLDPEQRQVAETLRGPVRVLAGAGTGKTRAITHRIAFGVATGTYAPTEVLAVTFTTKAAGEMRQRLRTMGAAAVQARTFHSAALRQLRYFWPKAYGTQLPDLIDSKLSLVGGAARRNRISPDQTLMRDLASEIEWAKVSNVGPDSYARVAAARGRDVSGASADDVARVFGSYEELKREQGRMDMEDILLFTAGMLADHDDVAAQVRRQYKWFVVDEFQDVSPLQSALLDLWLGGRDEVCVVGDPAQTIYSFAGAEARFLLDFGVKFPDATTVQLVRNYRSTPQVIEAANKLGVQGVRLISQQPAGAAVRLGEHPDEVAEAAAVAAAIARQQAAGRPLGEIAVLFRINAQSEVYEEALASRGIGFVVRGGFRFFERAEVREAVTRLRGAARAGEDSESLAETVTAVLSGMGWSITPPTGRGQARDRWESWQALVHLASEFTGSLADFVDDLDRRAAEQHAPAADGVTLATFHTAKGLEWDAVHLAGIQDGTLPFSYATTSAQIEEERRLLYVGMTRARAELSVTWSLARQPGGAARRKPSRFLAPMLPAPDRAAARPRTRGTRMCKVCGSPVVGKDAARGWCVTCPAPYDAALFDRLREWRKGVAAEKSKPAFVIFSDATLEAIAERRPASEQELLAVSGVGRAKLDEYGAQVLALLDDLGPSAAPPEPA